MAAARSCPRLASRSRDGLSPTNLARDLYQIADLIERCFGERLDSVGRSAIREMRAVGRLGPLLWPLVLLDRLGLDLGLGYVWRADGLLVGNTNLYRAGAHPWLGSGWLLANVAVHPEHRRRGIAQAMVQATLDLARKRGGQWVALQVEADNEGALALYRRLGFETWETLGQWEVFHLPYERALPTPDELAWPIRPRRWGDASAEADLIYRRARRGAMIWSRVIARDDFMSGLLESFLFGAADSRWVLPDPEQPKRLLGSLWVNAAGWKQTKLTLFLDPALEDPQGRQALLLHALRRLATPRHMIKLETVENDAPIDEVLRTAGFRRTRTLVQMRYVF